MADLTRILLVEDNDRFGKAACNYLKSRNLSVDRAASYVPAADQLQGVRYAGALIDCFFPTLTGSDDTDLGKLTIDKMFATDSRAQRIEEYEQAFSEFMDLTDPEFKKIVRYIGSISTESPEKNPVVGAFRNVSELNRDLTAFLMKKHAQDYLKGLDQFKDYFPALRKALEENPLNQPLGILIAEQAEEKRIPFVLVTSTYHHDILTQPIQDYCQRRKWTLIDCYQGKEDEKATPEFWQIAYETLKNQMDKK